MAEKPGGIGTPDALCDELFFSARARERDDNLIFVRERLLNSEVDRAALLDFYGRVQKGKKVVCDETNPLVSVLALSGIARAEDGRLRVRNRIYEHVFDRSWIIANLPDAERLRQRAAFKRGMAWAAAAVLVLGVASSLPLFKPATKSGVPAFAAIAGQVEVVTAGAREVAPVPEVPLHGSVLPVEISQSIPPPPALVSNPPLLVPAVTPVVPPPEVSVSQPVTPVAPATPAVSLATNIFASPQGGEILLVELAGKVEVCRAGSSLWIAAATNQVLQGGDRIRTDRDSRATLRWADASRVRLGARSQMLIQADPGRRNTFDLMRGLFEFFQRDGTASPSIRTTNATARIRG